MKIGILSRGPHLYSTRSLLRAAIRRGHTVKVIDHTRCNLVFERGFSRIECDLATLRNFEAIIPRIGASVTAQGAAVINGFEMMNVFTTVRSEALLLSRNKLRSLQKLARCGVDIPKTFFITPGQDIKAMIDSLGGLPVVIKLLEGTHGAGVILAESRENLQATIEAFHRLKGTILVQEYIREAQGSDIRAIVVAGEIVATMKRQAREGEFRSNLHRGATAERAILTAEEESIIKDAVRVMGLDVAGVDILRSSRGPLVMEVNASPGLEGIETATGIDVSGKIIYFIEKRYKEIKNYRNNLKRMQP